MESRGNWSPDDVDHPGLTVDRVDVDGLEPGLVPLPPDRRWRLLVGLVAVGCQPEGGLKQALHVVRSDIAMGQLGFGPSELLSEFGLLLAGDVVGHHVSHGLLGPPVALPLELCDTYAEALAVPLGALNEAAQLSFELRPQVGEIGIGDPLGLVLPGDGSFDQGRRQVRQPACCLAMVLSGAIEVLVRAAVAGGDEVQESRLAATAADRTLEVVLSPEGPVAGMPVGPQTLLDLVE